MKTLVISGGGSKGAFAGGVAEYLIKYHQTNYDLFVGSSTGSLLIPFLAIGDVERIKKLYTTISQSDIFTVCPFIVKYKNGKVKLRMNHFGIIKQFFKRQKTLGDSTGLRNLIRNNFKLKDFETIKALGKEVVVTVANLTTQLIEYKSTNDYGYEDFCDWMWASCNLAPLMSLYQKNGNDYADGGFGNLIPVQEAIIKGATEIDTIVLRQEKAVYNNPPLQNAIEVFARTSDFMLNQIANDDLIISKLQTANKNVKINFYFINRELTTHSFVFNKQEMTTWWQEGYDLFKAKDCTTHVLAVEGAKEIKLTK
ncbi:patatin-like phospholipase family protein [Pedobacter jeongneungensis]|uniref:patatin-like phospholipase family protein n=1 Tax=Pedobacter jeongneungensis TaxID=947309 RepID=UPI00046AC4A3|nr:patatin-like phospholipase family protein [Pedobacter jeongneungensis]